MKTALGITAILCFMSAVGAVAVGLWLLSGRTAPPYLAAIFAFGLCVAFLPMLAGLALIGGGKR